MLSARDIAFIGCRLLALYILYGAVLALTSNVYFFRQQMRTAEQLSLFQETDWEFYFASAFVHLGVSLLLWFKAGWLAGRIVEGATGKLDEAPASWSSRSALSVAMIAVGLWALIQLIPTFVYIINQFVTHGFVDTVGLLSVIIMIVLALLCTFGPSRIADFPARFRRW